MSPDEGSPVHAGELRALIEPIIVQLAVALEFAAILSGLSDQRSLPNVFLCPLRLSRLFCQA